MRLIFYILFISQLFYFLGIFAEQPKKNFSQKNTIKWKKVEEDKSNSPKKIFWKSHKENDSYFEEDLQEDDSYFEEDLQKDVFSKKKKNLFNESNLLKFGGLTVNNSILFNRGESNLSIDYDTSRNLFSSYSYSLSNIFQLNLINAGSFKVENNFASNNSELTNNFLGHNNFNYRVGGKLLFFNPKKNDLFWLSSRISLGRDLNSKQGYIYSDLTSTIRLNNWVNFNISPKYIFSGNGNLGSIGLSNNMNLSKKIQFIAETNIGITKNSSDNSTFSLRYAFSPVKSIDVFTTNAVGFQDLGTMLSVNDYKFGIRINYIF